MCKMASVTLVKTSVIARGKYTVLISGPVGEVESSLRAGREIAGKALIDEVIIRNVHSGVLAALETRIPVEKIEALGIIETREAVSAVRAADAAAKAAQVSIIEVRTSVGGGKGLVTFSGGAVRAAVAAGISALPEGMLVSQVIIPQTDPQLLASVGR
jgi:microcompartment protein CcmL/EutN